MYAKQDDCGCNNYSEMNAKVDANVDGGMENSMPTLNLFA